MARARRHRIGQAGQFSDMNPVRAVGRTGPDLMQKHQFSFMLAHLHGGIGQPIQAVGQRGQFVIMRGK